MGAFDLITLLEVLSVQKSIVSFWSRWFPRTITFETEEIAFDQVSDDYRRLAPFVAPNVQGRVQRQRGFSTVSYKPAYVKPKDIVRPNAAFARRPGESLATGSLSPEARRQATVAELLRTQRIKIDNTLEWMRAKALIDGKITIEGRDYPKVTVDFNRDASLTSVLVGGAKWDQTATAKPLDDLAAMRKLVNDKSGAVIRDFIFGPNAWALMYALVKDKLTIIQNNEIRGSTGTISQFIDGLEGVEFVGTVAGVNGAGQMNFWVYSQKYLDDAGVQQDILDTNTVVGISSMVEGVNCFGAIQDHDALRALEYFPKMWREQDPSVEYIMTQSAPLTVPKQPNATFSMKVAG